MRGRRVTRGQGEGASEQLLNDFINANNLLPEAIRILKCCDPKIQARVITRGSTAGVRDQIAVLKKRIQEASAAYNLQKDTSIYQEVEDFIILHTFDEKACHVLRTCLPDIQKSVLDRGLCTEATNPSAILLSRIRSAQKGEKGDGKGRDKGKGKGEKAGGKDAKPHWPELDVSENRPSAPRGFSDSLVAMGEMQLRGKPPPLQLHQAAPPPMGPPQAPPPMGPPMAPPPMDAPMAPPPMDPPTAPPPMGPPMAPPPMDPPMAPPPMDPPMGAPAPRDTMQGYGGTGPTKRKGKSWDDEWYKHKDPTIPRIHWLTLGPDNPLSQAGMHPEGVCMHYEKAQIIFQDVDNLLSEVMTNPTSDFRLEHDEDWTKFPGLGEAFQAMTGEENWYSVATSAQHGRWAGGWHATRGGREKAAKLALVITIASGTEMFPMLCQRIPEFNRIMAPFMQAAGQEPPQQPPRKKTRIGWDDQPGPGMSLGTLPPGTVALSEGLEVPSVPAAIGGPGTPAVFAVTVPETSYIVNHGYLSEAPTITFDKAFENIFKESRVILKCLIGEMKTELVHDGDWKQYPEVAKSFGRCGIKEDCFAVALCPQLCKWGIGIAASWKGRETAARLALCVAVALEAPHFEYAVSRFPSFQEICVTSGIMEAVPLHRGAAIVGSFAP